MKVNPKQAMHQIKRSLKAEKLLEWRVGPHYKLEKFIGEGSYG